MKTIYHLLAGTSMVLISSAFFGSTATLPASAQVNERQIAAGQQCRSCRPLTTAPIRSVFDKRREGEGHPTGTAAGGSIGGTGSVGSIGGSVGSLGISGSGTGRISGSGAGSISGSGSGSGTGRI